jgi:hypothetical protein
VTELERRAQLRVASIDEREGALASAREKLARRSAELVECEAQLDRRKRELDAYVRRVQSSLYSDR